MAVHRFRAKQLLAEHERHPGVRLEAVPVRMVVGRLALLGNLTLLGLELLQAHDVGPLALEPLLNLRGTRANAVDVPGGDLHADACRFPFYTSVLRYLRPESAMSVTTVALGPSRCPISMAATTFAPEEVPAKSASSRARRLAIAFASSVFTAMISSTSAGSHNGGV